MLKLIWKFNGFCLAIIELPVDIWKSKHASKEANESNKNADIDERNV
jgi:hypothetical protein